MTKQLLVIDTNIISHALTPNQTGAYAEIFRKLEKDYRFVVTGYTQYELLCSSNKEKQQKIVEYISTDMTYVDLTSVLMNFAARIFNLYKIHASTKGHIISHGDIINAAFAIAKNCPIITIDNNDYPTPFFREIARHRATYISTKNKETTDPTYILMPDLENIRQCCADNNL